MATANAFEDRARRQKTAKLAAHITELVSLLGLTPERDGYLIAELVRDWHDAEWNSAGINIGVKPKGNKPLVGVETRLAVLSWFQGRERKAG